MCGFNILYYGSVSARLSEKPRFQFGFGSVFKTEPRFRFGFVICFSALSFPLTHFGNVFVFIPFTITYRFFNYDDIEKMSKRTEHLKDWKLKRGVTLRVFALTE